MLFEQSAPENTPRDRRILVLVLIGLCICLPHLYTFVWRAQGRVDPQENQARLVWLATAAAEGSGLYRLGPSPRSWQAMLAGHGLPAASEPHLPESDLSPPVAYRLQANGQAQAIALPAQAAPIFFKPIPINQATLETLMVIPGIGQRLAAAIIAYRTRSGGISDPAALLSIEGIGAKKAAVIAGHVRFD